MKSVEREDEDAYAVYLRAQKLHVRGGHAVEAEALFRRSAAGGFRDAHYNLGILLRDLGRTPEAEASLRAAVSTDNPATASRAALAVARLLDHERDDPAAAHSFYEVALERGTGTMRDHAALSLALLLAAAGDRAEATALIQAVISRRYRRAAVKVVTDDSGRRFARLLSAIFGWPPANHLIRRARRRCYRAQLERARARLAQRRAEGHS